MRMTALRRVALAVLAIGAVASLLVAADRWRFERAARAVEISMDQQDLADFARAFGYRMDELLREMRRAGLTSVAVYEEIGQRVNLGSHAFAQSGQQLIDQARTSGLADPLLARMAAQRRVDPDSVYLIVFDRPTFERYLGVLGNQLEARNVSIVRPLRPQAPGIIAVKTQIDFFNSLGLGIPQDAAAAVRREGLLVDPRVQNNERLTPARIDRVFDQMLAGGRIGTVIFFGQRNEVLGYPYNLDATAAAFRLRAVNLGDVEAYDPSQIQKGAQMLGRLIPQLTVRLQAISKIELDKLDLDTVVARYLLGVRERNIRVIYLRPFPHVAQEPQPDGSLATLTAEQTNLKMLRELRDGLLASGFSLGRASGFVDFKGYKLDVLYVLAALGITAAFLILLSQLGYERAWLSTACFMFTLLALAAAFAIGRDDLARKAWALGGALTFGMLAALRIAPFYRNDPPRAATLAGDALRGIACIALAGGAAALGGIFIVGLLSQAAFMLQIDQFTGVKLLLFVPPLAALAFYEFSGAFGQAQRLPAVARAAVKAWHVGALVVLSAGAALLLVRSGNQPDIGVSTFESHLRGALTHVLGARPRFKEFLIGFPALMLIPALTPAHRRAAAWLLLLCAGVGIADILDTFSHVHTPLDVTLLRIVNGVIIGVLIGLFGQWLYRLAARAGRAAER